MGLGQEDEDKNEPQGKRMIYWLDAYLKINILDIK